MAEEKNYGLLIVAIVAAVAVVALVMIVIGLSGSPAKSQYASQMDLRGNAMITPATECDNLCVRMCAARNMKCLDSTYDPKEGCSWNCQFGSG